MHLLVQRAHTGRVVRRRAGLGADPVPDPDPGELGPQVKGQGAGGRGAAAQSEDRVPGCQPVVLEGDLHAVVDGGHRVGVGMHDLHPRLQAGVAQSAQQGVRVDGCTVPEGQAGAEGRSQALLALVGRHAAEDGALAAPGQAVQQHLPEGELARVGGHQQVLDPAPRAAVKLGEGSHLLHRGDGGPAQGDRVGLAVALPDVVEVQPQREDHARVGRAGQDVGAAAAVAWAQRPGTVAHHGDRLAGPGAEQRRPQADVASAHHGHVARPARHRW